MKSNLTKELKELIVVAGPTAVGKTDLTIRLAEELDTVILSADSRQVFRELSVGTAKPSDAELSRVPHYFVDTHSVTDTFSAGDFEREALSLLEVLFQQHDKVLMTGGSGLYIRAVCEGLDDLPVPLPGVREDLIKRLETEGFVSLQEEVAAIDEIFAGSAEFKNTQRVLRALEVFHSTGKPISAFQNKNTRRRPFGIRLIALERPREELYERINIRMDQMLKNGLVEEVGSVLEFRDCQALQTVGYKEVIGYLDGEYEYDEMVRLLKRNSRRYAKRQMTWFRHQGDFTWFHPDQFHEIVSYIKNESNPVTGAGRVTG